MPDFEQIYKEYFSDVYKYVLSLSRNESIAEEVTQETFFKAMRQIDKFKGNCKLYVWLCQIAKNTYYGMAKKHNRYSSDADADLTEAKTDIETEYLDRESANHLHILLHNLNDPYKEVFTLRIFGELPFLQIGELFGKTDSWARLIFYRAKKQLQEEMKISCEIIQDLLPLYHDGICSNDSRVMIEEHLTECENCKSELFAMDADLSVNSAEQNLNEAEAVKKLSKKWRKGMLKSLLKGILITVIVIALAALVLYSIMDIRVIPKP